MKLPLDGITVIEFSQYLAGPYAGLRLADLGARVIKVERPQGGDACRQLVTKNQRCDGDSVLFHTINRNKESFTADLKDPADLKLVKELLKRADVLTHNFRPGIMEKLGLDYPSVKALNPNIVYGEVSGYGNSGPWRDKPGQDLLAQSLSGLTWLSGNADRPPTPLGIATADMICGTHLAQGLLAALVRRKRKGIGAKVSVSLLESIVDLQFEGITALLNNNEATPKRSALANAHSYLEAPYGIYPTKDAYIAISMGSLQQLAETIQCPQLATYAGVDTQFAKRDEIKAILAEVLCQQTTQHWLDLLEPQDFWCSAVLDYPQLTAREAYQVLDMELTVHRPNGASITTTRCPIRFNGEKLQSTIAAPQLGNANRQLLQEIGS